MKEDVGIERERAVCRPPARLRREWERLITSLDSAQALGRKYHAPPEWGRPVAASAWCDEDGRLRASAIEYANGRRLETRHDARGNWRAAFTRTPPTKGTSR